MWRHAEIAEAADTEQAIARGWATVHALDTATGLGRWTRSLGQGTWTPRSPAIGRNGMLYIVDASTGTLIALK